LANNLIAVLSQALCPRTDVEGMVAAYEFMYVTPSIQNLIRENKVFRIDSEIQTGKRYGMQLLDDSLWTLYQAGKISAEEAIDKSKVPGMMMERFTRAGIDVGMTEMEMLGGGDFSGENSAAAAKPKPGGAATTPDAERRAQMEANRARMAAMAAKKQ
ncbi:MAG: hypothetical protein ABSD28_18300, partial [Tepidisphaeraceae bacterium]